MQSKLSSFLDRFGRDQSGAVAVEFVLIAPILFALLFGIIILGYFIGVSHSVSQLATGAARASVAGLDMAERVSLAETYLAQASTHFPLLIQDALTADIQTQTADIHGITIDIAYDIEDSLLDIANGFLGLSVTNITGSAFLAY